jgi:hypothetical protein
MSTSDSIHEYAGHSLYCPPRQPEDSYQNNRRSASSVAPGILPRIMNYSGAAFVGGLEQTLTALGGANLPLSEYSPDDQPTHLCAR